MNHYYIEYSNFPLEIKNLRPFYKPSTKSATTNSIRNLTKPNLNAKDMNKFENFATIEKNQLKNKIIPPSKIETCINIKKSTFPGRSKRSHTATIKKIGIGPVVSNRLEYKNLFPFHLFDPLTHNNVSTYNNPMFVGLNEANFNKTDFFKTRESATDSNFVLGLKSNFPYRKPATANIQSKRMREGLTKGQNQLMYEKIALKHCNTTESKNEKVTGSTSVNIKKLNKIKHSLCEDVCDKNEVENNLNSINFNLPSKPEENKNLELKENVFSFNKIVKNSINEMEVEENKNSESKEKFFSFNKIVKNSINEMEVEENKNIVKITSNNNRFIIKIDEKINFPEDISMNKTENIKTEKTPGEILNGYKFNFNLKSVDLSNENSGNNKTDNSSEIKNNNVSTNSDKNFTSMQNAKRDSHCYTDQKYNSNTNTSKYEDINISKVIKRVLEKNKKEASLRQREFFSNYPPSYLNLNLNRPQSRFFMGSAGGQTRSENYNRPNTYEPSTTPILNYLEINLKEISLWKKHEEIWVNISSTMAYSIPVELEKYLQPPNDLDVLVSHYCKISDKFSEKIIIDDNIQNPKEEMEKWKKAFKKVVLRWHPDKLFAVLDQLKIKDENKKLNLKKKSGLIMNHLNKSLKSILEILRKILMKRNDLNSK